jgi:hypothetical protein
VTTKQATAPDYKRIATQAVDLLCSLGFLGLHPSRQRELWQRALDFDRQLNPHRPRTVVWTEEEGDVHPPRREDGAVLPTVEFVGADESAPLTASPNQRSENR